MREYKLKVFRNTHYSVSGTPQSSPPINKVWPFTAASQQTQLVLILDVVYCIKGGLGLKVGGRNKSPCGGGEGGGGGGAKSIGCLNRVEVG